MEYNYLNELYHYGVKGQKWGVRRYQNADGSLKKGHKKRYGEWPPRNSHYQKKDGSLTNAGKKRIKESGTLGFPAYDRKKKRWKGPVKNRLAIHEIEDEQFNEVWKRERSKILNDKTTLKEAGYIFTDKPDSGIREHNNDIVNKLTYESKTVKTAIRENTERFIDRWADATIADLDLENTPQTKAFVAEHLRNTSTYAYRTLNNDVD